MTADVSSAADIGGRPGQATAAVDGVLAALEAGTISDADFRHLADHLPTCCWMANGDGYIVWHTRHWHNYCGGTLAEMAGWGWQSVHDPDCQPAVMARWTASIAKFEPFEMVFPLRGADGVFRPFLTRGQSVRDASGTAARWYGANTEISNRVAPALQAATGATAAAASSKAWTRAWCCSIGIFACWMSIRQPCGLMAGRTRH